MKFDLLPILNADGRKLPLNLELNFDGCEEQGARFLTPVSVSGEFVNIGGSIELNGEAQCRIEYICDRCCETFESDFCCSFEEVFKKEDTRVEDDNNPDAVILESEYNYGYLEVDIYHDSLNKELYFNSNDVWVKTTWDVAINALPSAVTSAIATEYPDYRIDDADYVDTPDGVYYSIEIEKGERDVYIKIAPDGTIK